MFEDYVSMNIGFGGYVISAVSILTTRWKQILDTAAFAELSIEFAYFTNS